MDWGRMSIVDTKPLWPQWLKLDTKTGTVSGIPPVAGTYQFKIKVTDSLKGIATQEMTLIVSNPD
jgi:hypothetical protein